MLTGKEGAAVIPVVILDPLPAFRAGLAAELTQVGFTVEHPDDLASWTEEGGRRAVIFTAGSGAGNNRPPQTGSAELLLVALVTNLDSASFGAYIKLGCHSVVDRAATPRAILAALELALYKHCAVPRNVVQQLVDHIPDGRVADLEKDQITWLRILASGSTVAELGHRVGYSTREMHRLLSRLYRQLGVKGRMEALILAGQHGLLTKESPTRLFPNSDRPKNTNDRIWPTEPHH